MSPVSLDARLFAARALSRVWPLGQVRRYRRGSDLQLSHHPGRHHPTPLPDRAAEARVITQALTSWTPYFSPQTPLGRAQRQAALAGLEVVHITGCGVRCWMAWTLSPDRAQIIEACDVFPHNAVKRVREVLTEDYLGLGFFGDRYFGEHEEF